MTKYYLVKAVGTGEHPPLFKFTESFGSQWVNNGPTLFKSISEAQRVYHMNTREHEPVQIIEVYY